MSEETCTLLVFVALVHEQLERAASHFVLVWAARSSARAIGSGELGGIL